MYGLPSLQMIILLGTVPVMVAFALVNYKQNVFSIVSFFVICANTFWGIWFYLAHMYTDWKRTIKADSEHPIRAIPDLNIPQSKNYALHVNSIKLDSIRLFNRTLINMRNGNLDVNMTEGYWIVEKPDGEENRWNKIGGKGRVDFVDMLDRGIAFGAYRKVGGQGKRVPADWSKIRRLERGEPLPQ